MTHTRATIRLATIVAAALALAVWMPGWLTKAEAAPIHEFGVPETLAGTITQVDVEHERLFVRHENGAHYSFIVVAVTRVTTNGRALKLADLAEHVGKRVTVTFKPMRHGNVAEAVEVHR